MNRQHPQILPRKAGVLLVNLGTPDSPTPGAIRRYLREFLSDRRVVEVPRALWMAILHLFILPFRPARLVHAYGSVWSPDGSPLMAISRQQASALQQDLQQRMGSAVPVELAMTYGQPSVSSAVDRLVEQGVDRIVVLPAYPQYSASTTAAAYDALWRDLMRRRRVPEVRTIGSYHDDVDYIAALAHSVREHWQQHGRGDHLLMSFHSVPVQYLEMGDPYFCYCHKSARLLAEALQLTPAQWSISFQSRLGNQPWLQPYTVDAVKQLGARQTGTLDVICPGFAADCLETLEEVAQGYNADFVAAGGTSFRYIPALNASAAHIAMLGRLAGDALTGWMPATTPPPDPDRIDWARHQLYESQQGDPA